MEGLLTLLIFAGLFFLMMRFGCGAHMNHGHSHPRKDPETGPVEQAHTDPVCGMQVDIEEGYGMMYQSHLYRFCSRNCLDRFEADPEQYVAKHLTHEHHHEGGTL